MEKPYALPVTPNESPVNTLHHDHPDSQDARERLVALVPLFSKLGAGVIHDIAQKVRPSWCREQISDRSQLELASEHPLGRTIVEEAENRRLPLPETPQNVEAIAGGGIRGDVAGYRVAVGSPRMLSTTGVAPRHPLHRRPDPPRRCDGHRDAAR